MADIPIFNNGDLASNIREKSLIPMINKVNDSYNKAEVLTKVDDSTTTVIITKLSDVGITDADFAGKTVAQSLLMLLDKARVHGDSLGVSTKDEVIYEYTIAFQNNEYPNMHASLLPDYNKPPQQKDVILDLKFFQPAYTSNPAIGRYVLGTLHSLWNAETHTLFTRIWDSMNKSYWYRTYNSYTDRALIPSTDGIVYVDNLADLGLSDSNFAGKSMAESFGIVSTALTTYLNTKGYDQTAVRGMRVSWSGRSLPEIEKALLPTGFRNGTGHRYFFKVESDRDVFEAYVSNIDAGDYWFMKGSRSSAATIDNTWWYKISPARTNKALYEPKRNSGTIGTSNDPRTMSNGDYYVTEKFVGAPDGLSSYVGLLRIDDGFDGSNGGVIIYYVGGDQYTLMKLSSGWGSTWNKVGSGSGSGGSTGGITQAQADSRYVGLSGDQNIGGVKTFDNGLDIKAAAPFRIEVADAQGVGTHDYKEVLKSTANSVIQLGSNDMDLTLYAKDGITFDKPIEGDTILRGELAAQSLEILQSGKNGIAINPSESPAGLVPVNASGIHQPAEALFYHIGDSSWVTNNLRVTGNLIVSQNISTLDGRGIYRDNGAHMIFGSRNRDLQLVTALGIDPVIKYGATDSSQDFKMYTERNMGTIPTAQGDYVLRIAADGSPSWVVSGAPSPTTSRKRAVKR